MVYIGLDNGVSGSIGIITPNRVRFELTPHFSQQDYVKVKRNVTRVSYRGLYQILAPYRGEQVAVVIEQPMVNNMLFRATISAVRAAECSQIVLETLGFPINEWVVSKTWQKLLLPDGTKGEATKTASVDVGCRLFPQHSDAIRKHKDADGLLLAEYCRRTYGRD